MNRLQTQLARLVEQQVLSSDQARELADAARADQMDGRPEPGSVAPSGPRSSAIFEVLGYVGGALVLGAVIMLARSSGRTLA